MLLLRKVSALLFFLVFLSSEIKQPFLEGTIEMAFTVTVLISELSRQVAFKNGSQTKQLLFGRPFFTQTHYVQKPL